MLDKKHVVLVTLTRSFLLGIMSALIAGCAGGVSILLAYLAITLLPKFGLSSPELSYSFTMTDALSNTLPGLILRAAIGFIFGLVLGLIGIIISTIPELLPTSLT